MYIPSAPRSVTSKIVVIDPSRTSLTFPWYTNFLFNEGVSQLECIGFSIAGEAIQTYDISGFRKCELSELRRVRMVLPGSDAAVPFADALSAKLFCMYTNKHQPFEAIEQEPTRQIDVVSFAGNAQVVAQWVLDGTGRRLRAGKPAAMDKIQKHLTDVGHRYGHARVWMADDLIVRSSFTPDTAPPSMMYEATGVSQIFSTIDMIFGAEFMNRQVRLGTLKNGMHIFPIPTEKRVQLLEAMELEHGALNDLPVQTKIVLDELALMGSTTDLDEAVARIQEVL